ncbi:phosphatase PAP2 family protein, partial [Acinetobacter baumannii]|nr:phosphatase PAP2 family protein [Acinetobacter baumannii]
GASFPSAHSVYASTLACLAMIMLCHKHNINSPYIVLISCLWFVCMGLSRIYAGVHFPTDVLAGWGIGFIWIALLWLWLLQTQSRLSRKQIYF